MKKGIEVMGISAKLWIAGDVHHDHAIDELGLPKLFWSHSHCLQWLRQNNMPETFGPIAVELHIVNEKQTRR